jgi:hypothetical protein
VESLAALEEGDAVVGDEVCEIVLVVVVQMSVDLAVIAQAVVVETRVTYQPHPLVVTRRNVRPVVFVQVLAKIP